MKLPKIGFVSMEFGLEDEMKTYCGGLGILSGDIFKSNTDLEYEMIGISILYKKGYFKQVIVNGKQTEEDDLWDYKKFLTKVDKQFILKVNNLEINYQLWKYEYKSMASGFVNCIYFIDTDIESNTENIRILSDHIYPWDKTIWNMQEILLGLGAIDINKQLNLGIEIFHLNESHSAVLALALRNEFSSEQEVREHLVFTTHTPLEGAHQKMEINILKDLIGEDLTNLIPKQLIVNNLVNYTDLCLYFAKTSNAVARRHKDVTLAMYPQYDIKYITNGVHTGTWVCEGLGKIYDTYLGNWRIDPNALRQIGVVPDQLLLDNHSSNKQNLCNYLKSEGYDFDPNVFTIGFARRTTGYKRADFILSQIDRLKSIAKKYGKLQIVFSGKAYPTDEVGKQLVSRLIEAASLTDQHLSIAFVPNYGIKLAKTILLGCDLWLNNPMPPLEASGTSGMKASINGIPNFSILDGWWVEGHLEGETGWSIGQDLCVGDLCKLYETEDLYSKLENEIYNTYQDKAKWVKLIKTCIALNGTYFNTHRVVQEYYLISYLK